MDKKAFDYQIVDGQVTQIGEAQTGKFLLVGKFPPGKDRSLTQEAIDTLNRAYAWSASLREENKK